ncbi:hypothetical protein E2C01_029943 [Portunus trituberculatus]|uniref:Uncharacterized protein n=1 Tax=Portunus trituberculatus TaxID=210409 RepID=A0A5B7EVY2_PORTR|nr:hypothetical protein [Portunus trituberculatus]
MYKNISFCAGVGDDIPGLPSSMQRGLLYSSEFSLQAAASVRDSYGMFNIIHNESCSTSSSVGIH